ncbi:MAG: hypothetical protein GKR99_16140 [Rhodobacteraceae bacterium]|nr:hypothetical protein [Paracoccaceae bacterium]
MSHSAPALAGWLDSGNRIVAAVFPAPTRRRVQRSLRYDRPGSIWSTAGILRRNAPDAEVHFVPVPGHEGATTNLLERLKPDLIISSIWMRKFPASHLSLARLGGVNIHPALLPLYRGPDPINGMIMAGDIEKAGGATLHLMSEVFDDGPIIAKIPLPLPLWRDQPTMRVAMGSAMYQLVRDDLSGWLSGAVTPHHQPPGHWHSKHDTLTDLRSDWPAERLLAISRLLLAGSRRRRTLKTPTGEFALPQILRRMGPPTGATANRLRFDCADARIEATGRNLAAIALQQHRNKLALRRSDPLTGLRSIQAGSD